MQPIIIAEIKKLLLAVGMTGDVELSTPPKPEMGDAAFPCFALAKELKKNPVEVAKDLVEKLQATSYPPDTLTRVMRAGKLQTVIERVQAFGPYVNFFVKSEMIVGHVMTEVLKKKDSYGDSAQGRKHSVMIEYPSNNTHKEFHIGHFRNICIGNTLVNLFEHSGYKVYPVNYLNDFGSHVAKCLWALEKFHTNEKPPENKQAWLGEIYASASQYLEEHPENSLEVAEVQKKLEAHDKSIWPLFIKTRGWSIKKFEELFAELGAKHRAVFYEKDIKKAGHKIVDELLAKKIATVGEGGAIIIDLSAHGLDIALVRKSNGVGLYLTSDLPLAEEKFKKYNVDESIVITGHEQVFYFKQLYKILELLGVKKKLTHISYGLVNLPEGKMGSRTGNVIIYEDLRDQVYERMFAATVERHGNWAKPHATKVAKILTVAALKFDFQKHESGKTITFNIQEATAVEGFSGPYLLYVVARINSLLAKAKKIPGATTKVDYALVAQPEEKQLAMMVGEYNNIIEKALREYNPSVIARYAFDLAQSFNDFYNKQSILNADGDQLVVARLALCVAVRQTLKNALGLLTIDTVEEM